MSLLVDVGNSAVKWGWLDAEELVGGSFEPHGDVSTLADRLHARFDGRNADSAFGCTVASAAVTSAVERAVHAATGCTVRWFSAADAHRGEVTLINGYREPRQLGADRWHAMVAAVHRKRARALVVVNAGTATTVDCIAWTAPSEARFVGGVIAPGMRLMRESLASGAAGLPLADGPAADFPDHTASAIVTGIADAQAGLVQRVRLRFARAFQVEPLLLLAGGHAGAMAALLQAEHDCVIDDNLVLRGIALRAAL